MSFLWCIHFRRSLHGSYLRAGLLPTRRRPGGGAPRPGPHSAHTPFPGSSSMPWLFPTLGGPARVDRTGRSCIIVSTTATSAGSLQSAITATGPPPSAVLSNDVAAARTWARSNGTKSTPLRNHRCTLTRHRCITHASEERRISARLISAFLNLRHAPVGQLVRGGRVCVWRCRCGERGGVSGGPRRRLGGR